MLPCCDSVQCAFWPTAKCNFLHLRKCATFRGPQFLISAPPKSWCWLWLRLQRWCKNCSRGWGTSGGRGRNWGCHRRSHWRWQAKMPKCRRDLKRNETKTSTWWGGAGGTESGCRGRRVGTSRRVFCFSFWFYSQRTMQFCLCEPVPSALTARQTAQAGTSAFPCPLQLTPAQLRPHPLLHIA